MTEHRTKHPDASAEADNGYTGVETTEAAGTGQEPAGSSDAVASPRQSSLVGRVVAAWVALGALVLAVARLLSLLVLEFLDVLGLIAVLALFAIGVWWSVTGKHVKRWVGYVLAVLGGIGAVAAILGFVVEWPRQFLSLIAFAVVFAYFSARALNLTSVGKRWRDNRITLPANASELSVSLERISTPAALIINERSGGGKAEQVHLADRARHMGIRVKVLGKEDDLVALADDMVDGGAEIIGMAGGDGSLGLVASVAMKHGVPFVAIPVGTRNHFARDLGLDRSDPLAALTAFYGHEVVVDVGDINGRTFLNNASFGIYADMVHEPGYRDAKIETGQAMVSEIISGDRDPSPLQFAGPEGETFDSAFLILVAVGAYEMSTLTDLGVRSSLEGGELQITVLEPADERQLRKITAAAVIGSLHRQDGFWQWKAHELSVSSPRGEVHVGVDGEALTFDSPVTVRVAPRALRVMVPDSIEPIPGAQAQPLSATITDLLKLAVGDDS